MEATYESSSRTEGPRFLRVGFGVAVELGLGFAMEVESLGFGVFWEVEGVEIWRGERPGERSIVFSFEIKDRRFGEIY